MLSLRGMIAGRAFRVLAGLAGIFAIAAADRELHNGVPLALLYLLPITLMATVLRRWQIPLLGLLCTFIAEFSDAFAWTVSQGIPRDVLYFLAYTSAGLYVSEALSRRRAEQRHVAQLESEIEVRRGVEEQLRLVVANSSIAIITASESGAILEANEAAERLFSGSSASGAEQAGGSVSVPPGGSLPGSRLSRFIPSLARVQIRKQGWEQLRTMMQCQAIRAGDEPFLADVWFSTYLTPNGGRLTAMIVDTSSEMREREAANLEQVMVGSRIAVGALSHEIRNICAAISVVQQNLLAATPGPVRERAESKEFEALRQLISALERIASVDLSLVKREAARLLPDTFLRDLYIVIHPSLRDAGIALEWNIPADLPAVWADQHSLLQVFLNLVRNAETALEDRPEPRVSFSVCLDRERVLVTVSDNGPGVSDPAQLFRPFASSRGAAPSSLGLYLSRAMMRSFHGDLRHQPKTPGASFVVELIVAEVEP